MHAYRELMKALKVRGYESLDIAGGVDARRRFPQPLDPEFPLMVRLYSFPRVREALGINWLNWHEHFELFFVIEGNGNFRMGDRVVQFGEGDLLLVDNLKLHGFVDLRKQRPRALVLYFMPSLIYTIGSPLCDYSFLSAFYNRDPASPPRLNLGSGANRAVCASLQRFLEHYFTPAGGLRHQAMTKLRLLDLLSELSAHLPMRRSPKSNHEQQNLDAKRMKTLFSFIEQHYAEPISRKQAASLVHLSESRFHTFFHKAAGTNFVSYLTHARVCQAARLLIEETFSVAEVAQRVGFSDQSYFDRRFKEHFGITPLKYRHQAGKPRAAAD